MRQKPEEIKALPFPESFVQFAAYHCDILHVEEVPRGSNSGEWVNRYLASAGVDPGEPWCASFITYLLKFVGHMPAVSGPAAVASWAHWAEKHGAIVSQPKRGDLFFLLHANGQGHIGIVLENTGGKIRTIEGNSNDDGSREGYEVVRRSRAIAGLRFIRLPRAA